MSQFCHACGAPLGVPQFKGESDTYCKHCVDESGRLRPRDQVKQGITQWIKSWQPGVSEVQAAEQADHYMKAMPAWAG